MLKSKLFPGVRALLLITGGCVLFALSFVLFLEPCRIAPGGVSGVGMVLSHATGLRLGLLILLLNIPLLLLALLRFGVGFIASTLYATLLSSLLIDWCPRFLPPFTSDLLLASLYGGLLLGAGMGLVFSGGATTGGSDVISKLVGYYRPHLSLGRIILLVDILIVLLCAAVFRDVNLALYAAITLYVSSVVIDAILYGSDRAVLTYIISDKAPLLGRCIRQELARGVTFLSGAGGHTGAPKQVILCAVRRSESARLGDLVHRLDPAAFVIVTEAHQVFGFGFSHYGKR